MDNNRIVKADGAESEKMIEQREDVSLELKEVIAGCKNYEVACPTGILNAHVAKTEASASCFLSKNIMKCCSLIPY